MVEFINNISKLEKYTDFNEKKYKKTTLSVGAIEGFNKELWVYFIGRHIRPLVGNDKLHSPSLNFSWKYDEVLKKLYKAHEYSKIIAHVIHYAATYVGSETHISVMPNEYPNWTASRYYNYFRIEQVSPYITEILINTLIQINEVSVATILLGAHPVIGGNAELASKILEHHIRTKNLQQVKVAFDYLSRVEPYHPSIKIAHQEIKKLEAYERLKQSCSVDIDRLNELSGVDFENLINDKFIYLGFSCESTSTTGDFGADLIVENREGTRFAIQCKRFSSKVNLKAVQEVVAALSHYGCDIGIVITNGGYLNSAIRLADSNDVELWDSEKLMLFLSGDITFSKVSE